MKGLAGWAKPIAGWALALATTGCPASVATVAPRPAEHFTGGRELVDLAELAAMREAADAAPGDLDAQWSAGMAHVWASLQGHVELRDQTERLLYRAWQLDPRSERLPTARVLGRYLNMRSSMLDLAEIDLQIAVYASLARPSARSSSLSAEQFHYQSFGLAARALADYGAGRRLAALAKVAELERRMDRRLAANPDEIDTHAMVGNYELTFAAVLPNDSDARLARAVEHLEVQQARWDEQSPGARDADVAPNVRSVFALWLAEGLLAAGRVGEADASYRRVIELADQDDTAPRRQMVGLAEHRLANLDRYAAAPELLPAWPAGVTSCVACHSREATLPIDDLHWIDEP